MLGAVRCGDARDGSAPGCVAAANGPGEVPSLNAAGMACVMRATGAACESCDMLSCDGMAMVVEWTRAAPQTTAWR